MRVVYRDQTENAGYLCGAVVVGALVGFILADGNGAEAPVLRWWGGTSLLAIVVVVGIRILRRSVVVDGVGITRRDVFATCFVPWTDVAAITFAHSDECTIRPASWDGSVTIAARARGRQPTLRDAYRHVREHWTGERPGGRAYPRPRTRLLTYAFIGSAIVLFVGGILWDDARYDAAVYAARQERETDGTATVTDVRVDEDDQGEGDPTYTTFVRARLRLPDRRSVVIEVHRPGDLADQFHDEDQLAVVYDAAHPSDADFADRPTREAQDDSVALRKTMGPLLFFDGLAGLLLFGAVMAVDWHRRLPPTRRTARKPRGAPSAARP